MSRDANPNVTLGEQGDIIDASVAVQLSDQLAAVRDRIVAAFDDLDIPVSGYRGELTLDIPADRIIDVLAFCRDDAEVACELLSDLSGVHWPGGTHEVKAQETTGWPTYTEEREGRIEVLYLLTSVAHNHRFRLRVAVPDVDPTLPTAEGLYRSAHMMEREVYDFFGVVFEGHRNLKRIEMPEDWIGHPQRKDYPLGGVDVQYKGGASVPPPDERRY
jgi:NADH-quinone oxidoreductase subunit C